MPLYCVVFNVTILCCLGINGLMRSVFTFYDDQTLKTKSKTQAQQYLLGINGLNIVVHTGKYDEEDRKHDEIVKIQKK